MVAVEAEGRRAEQAFHDTDRFRQPADAHAGLVDVDARGFVVGRHPAGADPEREPPFRHHVERRRHAVHEHGMAVVDAEDRRSQPQAVGGHRRGGEPDHRFGVVAVGEVVGHHDLVEPDRFQPAQTLDPVGDGQVRRGAVSAKVKLIVRARRSATAAVKSMASSGVRGDGPEIHVAHTGVDVRADVVGDLVGRAVRRVALESFEGQLVEGLHGRRRARSELGPTPHQRCSPWFQSTVSRPASVANCSTLATASRYRSGDRNRPSQPSPNCAVRRKAASDRPPITMGTGFVGVGRIVACSSWKMRPEKSTVSPARRARTIVSDSSRRRPRVVGSTPHTSSS